MSLNARETETSSRAPAGLGEIATQPSALEIPVLVNGARTVAGTDRREPFSENTQTVLVFGTGAVIKLASVVSIGQLLFLTNEKTKKEVVCQVVKSKTQASTSGYVELEFTEASPEFWGIRFATNGHASDTPAVARPLEASAAPLLKSLQEKLVDSKLPVIPAIAATEAPVANPAAQENAPAPAQHAEPQSSAPAANKIQSAPVVPAPAPVETVKIPTLSELLARSENGSELRSRDRATSEPVKSSAAKSEPEAKNASAKEGNGEYKNGLTAALMSTLNKAEAKAPNGSALLKPGNPAPGTFTFDFNAEAEEVKIPSWLEPLARNSPANPTTKDSPANEPKHGKRQHEETATITADLSGAEIHTGTTEISATLAHEEKPGRVLTLSGEGPVPNFGSGLIVGSRSDASERSSGSNKGLVLVIVAVLLLLIAAGAWYWFSNPTAKASNPDSDLAVPESSLAANPNVATPAASSAADRATNATSRSAVPEQNTQLLNAAAGHTREVPAGRTLATSAPDANSMNKASDTDALPEPAAKKPSVGKIHLAAPKRRGAAPDADTSEPDPAIGAISVAGEANHLNLLDNKNKPSAPAAIAVGGDVKAARLLSTVAPVYPQLARAQRVSGNVVIDALIDENGKVAGMKVGSGPALLQQAAMDALRQWKYQPATLNGKPVPMHLSITLQFKLP